MLSSFLNPFKSLTQSIFHNMQISSPNQIKFIDDALFCTTPFALTYTDPYQKWIIRHQLITLIQNFPSLKPSVAIFTHNNGTEVNLLNANGEIQVSNVAPPVPLTIWIHEFYPQMAPIVYVNLENCTYPIYANHPFVDCSGAIVSSYLTNWNFTKCNLSDLVHNLIKLFSHNHPFYYTGSPDFTHPSMVSKMEAMDRLVCMIYYDMAAIRAKTEEEIENLWAIQGELEKRKGVIDNLITRLEEERRRLKGRTDDLWEHCDVALNCLRVNERGSVSAIDDAFEALDGESENVLECMASDLGLEDLIYALDKAVGEGALSFEVYMKQVRGLAKEQFSCRDKMEKIERARDFG